MTINNNSGKLFTARFWALVALSLISCLLFLWLAWEVIAEKGEWLDTSGHTLGAFTLCGILVYMTLKTKWSSIAKLGAIILLLLYACLVGLSRIYLHVHFTSDVIASILVALWWLTLSLICIKLTHI
jgi:hypothetical protein